MAPLTTFLKRRFAEELPAGWTSRPGMSAFQTVLFPALELEQVKALNHSSDVLVAAAGLPVSEELPRSSAPLSLFPGGRRPEGGGPGAGSAR